MSAPLTIVNPSDKSTSRHFRMKRYVLWFGAHAATYLYCYARSLDDALETCAEWLAEKAPGLIMPQWSDEHKELYQEALEEMFPGVDEETLDDNQRYEADEQALADFTYTESGYIPSGEWGIVFEDPTRDDIKGFIADLAERHYSDSPVVEVEL